jgi:hypothetical protein
MKRDVKSLLLVSLAAMVQPSSLNIGILLEISMASREDSRLFDSNYGVDVSIPITDGMPLNTFR